MEALKWVGYLIAAIFVLSVIAGLGALVTALVFIGGAIVTVLSLLMFIASVIKGLVESSGSDK